jgi:hypothetical protein
MKKFLLTFLFVLLASPAWATTYFLAPASAGGSDSNNGTSTSTPWLTPNHNVNCGDILLAAAGNYPTFAFDWGTVSGCGTGSSASVAWVKCITFDACKISSSSQHAVAINSSNWGLQGFEVTTSSAASAGCFIIVPPSSSTSIHHVILANNIANGCQNGGFSAIYNGSAATDYIVYVGNIAYDAAQQGPGCASGFNIVNPHAFDSLPGTHMYESGNFSFSNVDGSNCGGSVATDGEGFILDSIFTNGYTQQMVIKNNIGIGNGGRCIEVYKNNSGSGAPTFVQNNTCWDNNIQLSQTPGGSLGEIFLYQSSNSAFTRNLAMTGQANGPEGFPYYAYLLNTPSGTNSVSSNVGYSATGTTYISQYGSGFSFGSNLTADPAFRSPSVPGAPSCGSATSVPNCMATIIANFTPSGTAAGFGYQAPSAGNVVDPLFPQWLCNVNLPPGLVTMGCVSTSSLPAPPSNVTAIVK